MTQTTSQIQPMPRLNDAAFKMLHWKKQNRIIEPVLMSLMRQIAEPIPTRQVALVISEDTGIDAKTASRILRKRFTKYAVQNGEPFEAYGKSFVGWMWQPLSSKKSA